jgi:hypothetical protein
MGRRSGVRWKGCNKQAHAPHPVGQVLARVPPPWLYSMGSFNDRSKAVLDTAHGCVQARHQSSVATCAASPAIRRCTPTPRGGAGVSTTPPAQQRRHPGVHADLGKGEGDVVGVPSSRHPLQLLPQGLPVLLHQAPAPHITAASQATHHTTLSPTSKSRSTLP